MIKINVLISWVKTFFVGAQHRQNQIKGLLFDRDAEMVTASKRLRAITWFRTNAFNRIFNICFHAPQITHLNKDPTQSSQAEQLIFVLRTRLCVFKPSWDPGAEGAGESGTLRRENKKI